MAQPAYGSVSIGVDIGQRTDPTAICVAEESERPRADDPTASDTHYRIRFLERLPLGTSYPDVGRHLVTVVAGVIARTGCRPLLYVDATGVGVPVVDTIAEAGIAADLLPVFFTYGNARTLVAGEIRMGKGWLVSRLQVLLQFARIALPDSPEARVLRDELLNYEIRISDDGADRYGAFKVGTHDDLVTALGLATQGDPTGFSNWLAFMRSVTRDCPRCGQPAERPAAGWEGAVCLACGAPLD